MLPDLARLDLNSCKPCGRGWPARASFAVPYNDWLENPSEVCLICQDPLDNDSTEYPWNHDEGSKVIQLCSNKHVYHVGCAAKTLITMDYPRREDWQSDADYEQAVYTYHMAMESSRVHDNVAQLPRTLDCNGVVVVRGLHGL